MDTFDDLSVIIRFNVFQCRLKRFLRTIPEGPLRLHAQHDALVDFSELQHLVIGITIHHPKEGANIPW
jgi:hypothetical protein